MSIDWEKASSVTGLKVQVSFQKSTINYSSFANLDMKGTKIIDCEAQDVDFSSTDLENADFHGTDLKDSVFSNTDLKRANFVGARNYVIHPMYNKLKGAQFALPYAAILLKSFDVSVEDEEGNQLLRQTGNNT